MSTSLDPRPTSFRQRFAVGRLRARDVVSIVLAGTAACGLALFGLDALLVDHPVQAEARAPAPATRFATAFTARDLGPYVGTWVSDGGSHLIVAKSGAVWADAGGLNGAARLDAADRTRLLFEGANFHCSYRIAADGHHDRAAGVGSAGDGSAAGDALVWTVVEGTPGTPCPAGRYSRRFTF